MAYYTAYVVYYTTNGNSPGFPILLIVLVCLTLQLVPTLEMESRKFRYYDKKYFNGGLTKKNKMCFVFSISYYVMLNESDYSEFDIYVNCQLSTSQNFTIVQILDNKIFQVFHAQVFFTFILGVKYHFIQNKSSLPITDNNIMAWLSPDLQL